MTSTMIELTVIDDEPLVTHHLEHEDAQALLTVEVPDESCTTVLARLELVPGLNVDQREAATATAVVALKVFTHSKDPTVHGWHRLTEPGTGFPFRMALPLRPPPRRREN